MLFRLVFYFAREFGHFKKEGEAVLGWLLDNKKGGENQNFSFCFLEVGGCEREGKE